MHLCIFAQTGRFGIGFNSVYHITDLPSFVSGRHLVILGRMCSNKDVEFEDFVSMLTVSVVSATFFVYFVIFVFLHADPHAKYLPSERQTCGKRWDFVSSGDIMHTQYEDSLDPYKIFGCDMKSEFQGTLFRFPLRTEQIAPTRLVVVVCQHAKTQIII